MRIRAILVLLLAVLGVAGGWVLQQGVAQRAAARTYAELASPDATVRRAAAARVADRPFPSGLDRIADALVRRAHPDIGTREAFVHALGRSGSRAHAAAVETTIDSDPSGYVRAAAWMAMARIDARHLETLLAADRPRSDLWDRLGMAQARLIAGDVSEVDVLLDVAESGEPGLREVASRALHKGLRPLLEAAGRWPAEADPAEGETWPAELLARVRMECRELRLQEVADAVWPRVEAAFSVRYNVRRLTNARNRLAGMLFE